jgi:dipeptidyl aminopeptidase/acylaminoacyl peptidase
MASGGGAFMSVVYRARATAPGVLLWGLLLLVPTGAASQQAGAKRVMGHEVYETWRTIESRAISADGRWVHYVLNLENGDGTLVVREVDGTREFRVERGGSPEFAGDSRAALFDIRSDPGTGEATADGGARRGGASRADTLGVLTLDTGEIRKIPGVRRWEVVGNGSPLLVYLSGGTEGEDDGEAGRLVVQELATGAERTVEQVSAFVVSDGGEQVAWIAAGEGAVARVGRLAGPGGDPTVVFEAEGEASRLATDDQGRQVAFLFRPPARDGGAEPPHELRHWRTGAASSSLVVGVGTPGLPEGWRVSGDRDPAFSRSGGRLVFGTTPRPLTPGSYQEGGGVDSAVRVEVWHWQDPQLMTVQNVRRQQEERRSYAALVHLERGRRVVQLATEALPDVEVPSGWDGETALGSDTGPYAIRSSWETPSRRDIHRVDPMTGESTLLLRNIRGNPSLSPGGRYLTWWEGEDRTWWAHDLRTGNRIALSGSIPFPVHNEMDDTPAPPGSYGSPGWTEGDRRFLLHDRFDLWAVDPSDPSVPLNLTRGEGRRAGIRLRLIRTGRDGEGALPGDGPTLLSAFHERTKRAGFYRGTMDGGTPPQSLLFEDRAFSVPVKAAAADRWLLTRESFQEFPDLWVSDADFRGMRRVSDANPQQGEYRWGTAELVEWISQDGVPLQGVLMKPEDFDPTRQYPLVVYFYERWSDGLHSHYAPVPHRSRIAFPMYTSRDYLVFIPDIVYRVGFPGESALNAIVPGVMHLVNRGFVDRQRMGLQGHSWGGYQIAFMVTRTGALFRAAAPGAPVANMTSAYGGIRRESGLVRNFNYESTQSRIGESLWEAPLRYLENSPLFWLDKVETPLLIMHNDRDGHVPWEQGVELFTAMRRLGKPAWLINYTGEPHWPTSFANRRDWNIRLQQFFDHYLKDAPPPEWMVEGIPAVRRGETLGLELVDPQAGPGGVP